MNFVKGVLYQVRRAARMPRFVKRRLKEVAVYIRGRLSKLRNKAPAVSLFLCNSEFRKIFLHKKKIKKLEKANKWHHAAAEWVRLIDYLEERASAESYVNLSRALQKTGNLRQAAIVLDEAAKKYPINKSQAVDQDLREWLKISREKSELSYLQIINNIDAYRKQVSDYNHQKNKRSAKQPRIAIFAAVAGGYDTLKPPVAIDSRFDYVFFTDTPTESMGIYDVRPLPYMDADPTRSARFVKTHPHYLLSDYDIAVWVDANLLITGDIYPIIESVVNSGSAIGAMRHPVRKSPYEEMSAVIRQRRDDVDTVREQEIFYKSQHYETEEMIESNVLVYDLRDDKLNGFLNDWWSQIDRFSRRDQFSINYSLDKHDIKPFWFTDRPNSARNHPAFALTDHRAEMGGTRLPELLKLLGPGLTEPFKGDQYSSVKSRRLKRRTESISVVVPVHNALKEVKECLESVKKHKHSNLRLIVLDDGSDLETEEYLKGFHEKNKKWTQLVRHNKARGFTRTANEGMKISKADMTVILNSDTIVTKDWALKLADVMFTSHGVGIVGPLSSAASHQSVPEHRSGSGQTAVNDLPKGVTVEEMNAYAEKWSYTNLFPRVPLVHGFCFAVRREVIEKVGLLDEKAFPRGYGEENDYCFRATDAGFNLAIATNTYIYHHKSKSFVGDERKKLMDDGMSTLIRKHGVRRINHSVKSMQKNPTLVNLRSRFWSLYG